MKIFIGVLFSMMVYADTIYTVDAVDNQMKQTYLKIDGDNCYYKNEFQNPKSCYLQTGNIFIKTDTLLEKEFLNKYNLEFVKVINQQNNTAQYKVMKKRVNIIDLINKINRDNKRIRARIEWIRPRRLL
jgi:hypothetical protein